MRDESTSQTATLTTTTATVTYETLPTSVPTLRAQINLNILAALQSVASSEHITLAQKYNTQWEIKNNIGSFTHYDKCLLMHLLAIAKEGEITITIHKLLRLCGKASGPADYRRMKKSIERLAGTKIIFHKFYELDNYTDKEMSLVEWANFQQDGQIKIKLSAPLLAANRSRYSMWIAVERYQSLSPDALRLLELVEPLLYKIKKIEFCVDTLAQKWPMNYKHPSQVTRRVCAAMRELDAKGLCNFNVVIFKGQDENNRHYKYRKLRFEKRCVGNAVRQSTAARPEQAIDTQARQILVPAMSAEQIRQTMPEVIEIDLPAPAIAEPIINVGQIVRSSLLASPQRDSTAQANQEPSALGGIFASMEQNARRLETILSSPELPSKWKAEYERLCDEQKATASQMLLGLRELILNIAKYDERVKEKDYWTMLNTLQKSEDLLKVSQVYPKIRAQYEAIRKLGKNYTNFCGFFIEAVRKEYALCQGEKELRRQEAIRRREQEAIEQRAKADAQAQQLAADKAAKQALKKAIEESFDSLELLKFSKAVPDYNPNFDDLPAEQSRDWDKRQKNHLLGQVFVQKIVDALNEKGGSYPPISLLHGIQIAQTYYKKQ